MKKGPLIFPLSPAHLFGIGSFQIAAALLFFKPELSVVPLVIYIVICAAAPFFPGSSFFLPVISRGTMKNSVSLTFDDGPDPEVTPRLLDLLKRSGIRAAFFVTGEKAEKYPEIIRRIIEEGHDIGNHTYSHDPLIMLKSYKRLESEINKADKVIKSFGIETRAFRPPVGITSPRLWRFLLAENLFCLNFSVKAADFGNRRIKNLSEKIVKKAGENDIILLHDVKPSKSAVDFLLDEFEKIITGLRSKNLDIVPLSELIGRDIISRGGKKINPAQAFYDDLGSSYDFEQSKAGVSPARRMEWDLFKNEFCINLNKNHSVLELGAGTGRFTLPIAERTGKIVAVDISTNMLNVLKEKAQRSNINNITLVASDIEEYNTDAEFDAICSFSALEYIADIEGIIKKAYNSLKPGGVLYIITSRRSFFRFFVQIGNAMRQGVWLRARSNRQFKKYLQNAGFNEFRVKGHLFRSFFSGGMLAEVKAIKGK